MSSSLYNDLPSQRHSRASPRWHSGTRESPVQPIIKKQFYVYILASRPGGALYIGIMSDLIKRVYQHKNEITGGHTSRYNIKLLVYYEICDDPEGAILREKQLKKWTRAMKNELNHAHNPL